jgi:hypothetical protein
LRTTPNIRVVEKNIILWSSNGAEFEAGDHTKIEARASNCPKQIRVRGCGCCDDAAISEYYLSGLDEIYCKTVTVG